MNSSTQNFWQKHFAESRFLPALTRRRLYILAGVLGVLGLLSFAMILAGVLFWGAPATIDAPIEEWLRASRTDFLTGIMIGIAVIFGPIALPIIVLVVVVVWSIATKHFWRPLLLASGTLTGVILALTITHLVGRGRPPVDLMLFGPDHTFSFPSGHVLGACNFLLLMAYLIFSRRSNPRTATAVFVVVGLLIVAVALSRVYLGYHWATDALASVALSLIILGAVIAVDTHHTVKVSEASLSEGPPA